MDKVIYLAGGCFWGVEALIKRIPGVTDTCCGYANGTGEADASYPRVCSGETGFRETVRVCWDSAQTTISTLMTAFFLAVDPEVRNRQGNDVGTQYQSGIYWESDDERTAEDVKRFCERVRVQHPAFAVELKPLENFYAAEEYHQDYLDKNPGGYCHVPLALIERAATLHIEDA